MSVRHFSSYYHCIMSESPCMIIIPAKSSKAPKIPEIKGLDSINFSEKDNYSIQIPKEDFHIRALAQYVRVLSPFYFLCNNLVQPNLSQFDLVKDNEISPETCIIKLINFIPKELNYLVAIDEWANNPCTQNYRIPYLSLPSDTLLLKSLYDIASLHYYCCACRIHLILFFEIDHGVHTLLLGDSKSPTDIYISCKSEGGSKKYTRYKLKSTDFHVNHPDNAKLSIQLLDLPFTQSVPFFIAPSKKDFKITTVNFSKSQNNEFLLSNDSGNLTISIPSSPCNRRLLFQIASDLSVQQFPTISTSVSKHPTHSASLVIPSDSTVFIASHTPASVFADIPPPGLQELDQEAFSSSITSKDVKALTSDPQNQVYVQSRILRYCISQFPNEIKIPFIKDTINDFIEWKTMSISEFEQQTKSDIGKYTKLFKSFSFIPHPQILNEQFFKSPFMFNDGITKVCPKEPQCNSKLMEKKYVEYCKKVASSSTTDLEQILRTMINKDDQTIVPPISWKLFVALANKDECDLYDQELPTCNIHLSKVRLPKVSTINGFKYTFFAVDNAVGIVQTPAFEVLSQTKIAAAAVIDQRLIVVTCDMRVYNTRLRDQDLSMLMYNKIEAMATIKCSCVIGRSLLIFGQTQNHRTMVIRYSNDTFSTVNFDKKDAPSKAVPIDGKIALLFENGQRFYTISYDMSTLIPLQEECTINLKEICCFSDSLSISLSGNEARVTFPDDDQLTCVSIISEEQPPAIENSHTINVTFDKVVSTLIQGMPSLLAFERYGGYALCTFQDGIVKPYQPAVSQREFSTKIIGHFTKLVKHMSLFSVEELKKMALFVACDTNQGEAVYIDDKFKTRFSLTKLPGVWLGVNLKKETAVLMLRSTSLPILEIFRYVSKSLEDCISHVIFNPCDKNVPTEKHPIKHFAIKCFVASFMTTVEMVSLGLTKEDTVATLKRYINLSISPD